MELANEKDIKEIEKIYEDGKQELKNSGVEQWQNGYPNKKTILNDIDKSQLYLWRINDKICAVAALVMGREETYEKIDGSWTSDQAYATLHRLAISKEFLGKGLTNIIFKDIESETKRKGINWLRVDTHEKNDKMRYILQKNLFFECGVIDVIDGQRIAYDKRL